MPGHELVRQTMFGQVNELINIKCLFGQKREKEALTSCNNQSLQMHKLMGYFYAFNSRIKTPQKKLGVIIPSYEDEGCRISSLQTNHHKKYSVGKLNYEDRNPNSNMIEF